MSTPEDAKPAKLILWSEQDVERFRTLAKEIDEMKRASIVMALALALIGQAWAGIGLVYNADISVDSTNTATVFYDNGSGGIAASFNARTVLVRSLAASANTCAFDLKDTTAVYATDTKLEPGGSISLDFPSTSIATTDGWPGMGAICDTAQTATFRITALR